jgi:hypothetical protein
VKPIPMGKLWLQVNFLSFHVQCVSFCFVLLVHLVVYFRQGFAYVLTKVNKTVVHPDKHE